MAKGTPAQIAQKWVTNTQAAITQGYVAAGVDQYVKDNPTQSPGQKAALMYNLWFTQIQKASGANGKWATNTGAVTNAEWSGAMKGKGVTNMATGVPLAQQKYLNFYNQLDAYITADPEQAAGLPQKDGSLQGGINRATKWINYMAAFKPTHVR